MSAPATARRSRLLVALGALVALLLAALVLGLGGSGAYLIRVDFADAGQLVDGDLVEVAGIPVGTVTALDLTPDGQARVTAEIDASRFTPLHAGTHAAIGTVGLSGVTNRFLALEPGPQNTRALRSGSVLPQTATTPIVDIDALFDAITPAVRRDLRGTIQHSATVLQGRVPAVRRAITYSAPAVERAGALLAQVDEDRYAFRGLLGAGARTAQTLGAVSTSLTQGIASTAATLQALADARGALSTTLARAPAVLRQGTHVLDDLRTTLPALDPVLRDAQPVAGPLAGTLRTLVPTAQRTAPVLAQLQALLPSLHDALQTLPAISRAGRPALATTARALGRALPILTGLRPYGEDILIGFLHGYGGGSAENYDANGQFSRIALGLPTTTLLTSILGFDLKGLSPAFLTGQTNKCPGSAAEPAADGSNHIIADGCDPKQVP